MYYHNKLRIICSVSVNTLRIMYSQLYSYVEAYKYVPKTYTCTAKSAI